MAITVTHNINGALRSVALGKGLKVKHLRFSISTTGDYVVGTGFVITPAMAGMRTIWSVFGVTVRTSANALRGLIGVFDYNTGGIRFFEQEAAAPLAEAEQADFAAGDIIDCIVLGV